ncbi:MAG: ABC transporter ATP-binding protein [Vicinamibacteria bacterium]
MDESSPLVVLTDVHKTYQKGETQIRAVDGVSLRVEKNESLAIVGRSGSGKSTLMSLIGCIDVPTSGQISFRDRRIESLSDRERSRIRNASIGFVFQSFHLIPELTVEQNVETPMLYSGLQESQWREPVRRALNSVALESRATHFPSELSGGEAQRVAIARALVREPELVLADEPTGNLDSATEAEIAELLFALPRAGRSLVLITHDLTLARRADRCIELSDGRRVEGKS